MKIRNPLKRLLFDMERFFRNLGKNAARLRKRQKIYKFAVYGRAASGKTCILAALAMKCIAHPSNYTSTWILEPVGMPRPDGPPETWDIKKPASAFHLGKIWLEKAIERLSKGELPPPNPNRAEPLRYLYHFTSPNHRTYPVELIDYSGELIDPAITHDEMAQHLREHISTMDGILVLAEVPHPKDDNNYPLTNELLKLEQAFALLKDESDIGPTLDIPLALLINKWDRRNRLRYTTPENEYNELLRFLESKPEPPHKSLVDALRNSVTAENFKVFPVSAFGEYELAKTSGDLIIERPKQVTPLQSFGLEDGFIWAAQRRDVIDLDHFEEKVSRKSSWCFLKNATIFPTFPLFHTGGKLAARFAKSSPERKRIKQALKKFSLTITVNSMCFLVIFYSFFVVAEVLYDNFRYRTVLTTKDGPRSSLKQLKTDEEWLAAYYQAPFYLHPLSRVFVLDRNTAIQDLNQLRRRREEILWKPVETASDDLVRVELARKYLLQFSENGKYRNLAEIIVTRAEQSQKYLENQIYINNIATLLESMLLKGTQNEKDFNELYEKIASLPNPQALSDELYEQQEKLLNRITNEKIKLATAKGEEKWRLLHEKYQGAMLDGDVSQAVKYLYDMRSQTFAADETARLFTDFKSRALAILQKNIDRKTKKKLWRQARNLVGKAQNDQQLISLLTARQLKRLRHLQTDIDVAEDKDLYEQVIKYKDMEHVRQYLKYAPLKKMQRAIARYQKHLYRLSAPLKLRLALENISWGGRCSESDIVVTFNGKKIIEKTNFKPSKNGRTDRVGSTSFRSKLGDIAKIQAKVTCESWWSGKSTGEASWEGTIHNLSGLRLILERDDSDKSSITFSLSGLPEEPILPGWGS